MNAILKQRFYETAGKVAIGVSTALFSSPFVIVAIFLVGRVYGAN